MIPYLTNDNLFWERRAPKTTQPPQMSHRYLYWDWHYFSVINVLTEKFSCYVSLYADNTLLYQTVGSTAHSINALKQHQWIAPKMENAIQWEEMPSNKLWKNNLRILIRAWWHMPCRTESKKYIDVTIQSDPKFDQHITEKYSNSRKIFERIKYFMYNTPKEAKLLA